MKLDKLGLTKGQDTGLWQALETAGDVKRFLRWAILSVRDGSLDNKTAGVLGQLGLYLLKAIEAERSHEGSEDKATLFLDFLKGLVEYIGSHDPDALRALEIHLRPFADHIKSGTGHLLPSNRFLLTGEKKSLSPDTLRKIREEVYGLTTLESAKLDE